MFVCLQIDTIEGLMPQTAIVLIVSVVDQWRRIVADQHKKYDKSFVGSRHCLASLWKKKTTLKITGDIYLITTPEFMICDC